MVKIETRNDTRMENLFELFSFMPAEIDKTAIEAERKINVSWGPTRDIRPSLTALKRI